MRQAVLITKLADRHKDNNRAFAESYEIEVEAGTLEEILLRTAAVVEDLFGISRYNLTISEPYE